MSGPPSIGRIVLEVTRRCPRRCPFCYLEHPGDDRAPAATGRTHGATLPELPAHELPAHELPAHELPAHELPAHELPAHELPAHELAAHELPAHELAPLTLALARDTGCESVQLSGGEPLLRRDLPELIGRLGAAGLRVSLLTDGALMDEAGARALSQLGVHTVQPTLLSATPALHDALRGPGAFLGATHAIAAAAAAGLQVSVSYVITAPNADPSVAQAVAELAFALGARTLALSRFCPTGPAAARAVDLLPTPSQVREAVRAAATACRRLGLSGAAAIPIPACVFEDPLRPPLPTGSCALLAERTVVTLGPDGGLRSCSLSTRPVGNLREEPWEALAERLWEGELAPLRAAVPRPCRGCPAWEHCRGGCRLSGLAVTGVADGMDPLAPPDGRAAPGRDQGCPSPPSSPAL